ncbi:MAG: hypothetical protein AB7F08_08900, partial [Dongiaceae bacterium]
MRAPALSVIVRRPCQPAANIGPRQAANIQPRQSAANVGPRQPRATRRPRPVLWLGALFAGAVMVLGLAGPAAAQSMEDELQRLQRELSDLQAYV